MAERSQSLDLIRGLAALFVLFEHVRAVFFVPFDRLDNPGPLSKLFYFVTGYGEQSVLIFFVLSGYFVGAAFENRFEPSNVGGQLGNYFFNRLTRLWTVLIPALLLTAILDWVGVRFTGQPDIYGSPSSLELIQPSNDRSIVALVGNLCFVQTILVPTFGTNMPLWSLANEFWYYLLFPMLYLLAVPAVKGSLKLKAATVAVAGFVLLLMFNPEMLRGFAIWLIGFAVHRFNKRPNPIARWIGVAFFLAVFAIARFKAFDRQDVLLGIATGGLILSVRDLRLNWFDHVSQYFSDVSYTLYLVHLPALIFLKATVLSTFEGSNHTSDLLMFMGIVAGVVGFAHLFYMVFEKNTGRVREWARPLGLR